MGAGYSKTNPLAISKGFFSHDVGISSPYRDVYIYLEFQRSPSRAYPDAWNKHWCLAFCRVWVFRKCKFHLLRETHSKYYISLCMFNSDWHRIKNKAKTQKQKKKKKKNTPPPNKRAKLADNLCIYASIWSFLSLICIGVQIKFTWLYNRCTIMHPARRMSFFLILEQINTDRIPKAKKYFVNVHLLYTFLKKILVGNYIYVSYRGRFYLHTLSFGSR